MPLDLNRSLKQLSGVHSYLAPGEPDSSHASSSSRSESSASSPSSSDSDFCESGHFRGLSSFSGDPCPFFKKFFYGEGDGLLSSLLFLGISYYNVQYIKLILVSNVLKF